MVPARPFFQASLLRAAVAAATMSLLACGGGSPVAPAPVGSNAPPPSTSTCSVTVPADQMSRTIAAATTTFALNVSAGSGCVWAAATSSDFLSITAGATGTGPGTVEVRVAQNTGEARSGSLVVGSVTVVVNQEAAEAVPPPPAPPPAPPPPPPGCEFAVAPTSASLPASGGNVTVAITVTQGSGCAWTATANDAFISINGSSSGTGNANVVLVVAANSAGNTRTGSVSIAGQTVTITQPAASAPECRFDVSPKNVALPVSGGTATFTVTMTSGAACAWSTTVIGTGLTIVSGASGIGSGTVVASVEANPGTQRWQGIIIAGQHVTISQPEAVGACVFSISPKQFTVSNAAQTVAFDVTITTGSPSYCSWSAGTLGELGFLHVTSMTQSGNTTRVVVAVDANPKRADRAGSVTVADQIVAIRQLGTIPQGPCKFSVSPTTISAPASASTATVVMTLVQGSIFDCGWGVAPQAPFITIASSVSHPDFDGATIVFAIAANAGAARTGTVIIEGNTVTVNQAAAGSQPPPD